MSDDEKNQVCLLFLFFKKKFLFFSFSSSSSSLCFVGMAVGKRRIWQASSSSWFADEGGSDVRGIHGGPGGRDGQGNQVRRRKFGQQTQNDGTGDGADSTVSELVRTKCESPGKEKGLQILRHSQIVPSETSDDRQGAAKEENKRKKKKKNFFKKKKKNR